MVEYSFLIDGVKSHSNAQPSRHSSLSSRSRSMCKISILYGIFPLFSLVMMMMIMRVFSRTLTLSGILLETPNPHAPLSEGRLGVELC